MGHSARKLTLEDAREIRYTRKIEPNITLTLLAQEFKVNPATIDQILKGITYKDIPHPKGMKKFTFNGETVFVSSDGKVWSNSRKHYFKPYIDKDGYQNITLGIRKIGKKVFGIHVLVLTCFDRPPKLGEEGRHLDGNPSHNEIKNLKWGNHAENEKDKEKHGSRPKGEKHVNSKLTVKQVKEIRFRWKIRHIGKMKFYIKMARKFNVSVHCIRLIVFNHTWTSIE